MRQSFVPASSWTKQIQGDNTREECLSSESISQPLTEDKDTHSQQTPLTEKDIHSEDLSVPHRESNSRSQIVTAEEVARTIVEDDEEWKELQYQIKKAKVVTSLGVNQFCSIYFKEKAAGIQQLRDIQASREKQTSPAPENNIARLKKRLSLL